MASLTCYEEIGLVGRDSRMLQRCYEETAAVEFRLKAMFTSLISSNVR